MADIIKDRLVKPMLVGLEQNPFDSEDYIFELKLDGERCIAYLEKNSTELRNKRNNTMISKLPELAGLHEYVKKECILDGELIIIKEGLPSFDDIKVRSIMSNSFKIELASKKLPATFVAYDILYYDGEFVTNLPLMERKKLLIKNTKKEDERFALSRYISGKGTALFELAKAQNLEGIVAKKKNSLYHPDTRTKEWIKIKNMKDDDFVICGYIIKSEFITSLVIAQYDGGTLVYKGHVTMGISKDDFKLISAMDKLEQPPIADVPKGHGNEDATWIRPILVCTVKYMDLTPIGGLRQPVFKGLRHDKSASECIVPVHPK